ncbi:MAG: hypothetical protein LBC77_01850, partial [Spirochaetaceae bacterium]|nr:hypothetical protein [Spirochaetaceae bacterium]
FSLANNIDLSEYKDANGNPVDWTGPSGFSGKLYGNGHAINNVRFRQSGSNTGIFNSVLNGAEIYDLTVNVPDNGGTPRVTQNNNTSRFGIIVGQMNIDGTIKLVNVTVNGKLYIGTGASGHILIGGFIGEMNQGGRSTVIFERCVSNLDIDIINNASNIMCGSFIGRDMNGFELRNSYSTGSIKIVTDKTGGLISAGGFIGRIDTNKGKARIIENCYSMSSIEVIQKKNTANSEFGVGGFVGGAYDENAEVSVKNSVALNPYIKGRYNDGSFPVISNFVIGRIAGRRNRGVFSNNAALDSLPVNDAVVTTGAHDNANAANVSAAELANPSWWQGAPLSWSSNIWDFSNVSGGGYPKLKN